MASLPRTELVAQVRNRDAFIQAAYFCALALFGSATERAVQECCRRLIGKKIRRDDIRAWIRERGPKRIQGVSKAGPRKVLKMQNQGPNGVQSGTTHARAFVETKTETYINDVACAREDTNDGTRDDGIEAARRLVAALSGPPRSRGSGPRRVGSLL